MKKTLSYIVYWLIQCTWGLPMTLIGAIAALVLLITGHNPKTIGPNVYFQFGNGWGGIELGGFFLCSKTCDMHTKYHESGHALQNLIWGPLMPFVICIPSAARYWLREMPTRHKKSLFNLFFLLAALVLTTGLACITGPLLHIKWLTIFFELLRMYFLCVSIWLTVWEIPKYDCGCYVDSDSIWFEGQATEWGTKVYEEKKED